MQSYDIYNPKAALGLGVLTRNRGYLPMTYALEKDDGRGRRRPSSITESFIQSRPEGQGSMRNRCCCLIQRIGTRTFSAYQKWLAASWHSSESLEDRRAGRKHVLDGTALINSAVLSEMYNHTPTFFDAGKREVRYRRGSESRRGDFRSHAGCIGLLLPGFTLLMQRKSLCLRAG